MKNSNSNKHKSQVEFSVDLIKYLNNLLTEDLKAEYFGSDEPTRSEIISVFSDNEFLNEDDKLVKIYKDALKLFKKDCNLLITRLENNIKEIKDPFPKQWMVNDKRIWKNLNSSKAKHFCAIMNALEKFKWKSRDCKIYEEWPMVVEAPYEYLKKQYGLSYRVVKAYLVEMNKQGFILLVRGASEYGRKRYSLGHWCKEGKNERVTKFPYKKYFLKNTKNIRERLREFSPY